jgi:DUF1680 family protein
MATDGTDDTDGRRAQPLPVTGENGYAVLRRASRPGDQVELNLPMQVGRVVVLPLSVLEGETPD